MKKAILVLVLGISSQLCFSQAKKQKGQSDSLSVISDSTLFVSLNDLSHFDRYLKDKFTVAQYEVIMKGINGMINQAAAEYRRKNKPAVKSK